QADCAFFGEKDYQQLQVVKRLVADLDIPIRITGCPTVREKDGLAMSSRNVRLSVRERSVAPALYRVLCETAGMLVDGQETASVLAQGCDLLRSAGFSRVEYLELRHAASLAPLETLAPRARLLAAVHLGEVRLIDNIDVGQTG
ncbi:MAG: pantoate--beta-alanine ligase, partial [Paracoccaceae bacterium]